jgi:hypothetical protein
MENIYIGSTKDLHRRKMRHKRDCNNETTYNLKVYQYIRENGGMENFKFIILEECEVEKLKRLEQSYMDVYKPTLNMCYANGWDIERYREYAKEYRQVNKEHIKEIAKEWREKNKEHLKEYHQKNREHKMEYLKNYYEINKEYQHEKFDCECGGKFIRRTKLRHQKSKMHQRYLENNNNISTV